MSSRLPHVLIALACTTPLAAQIATSASAGRLITPTVSQGTAEGRMLRGVEPPLAAPANLTVTPMGTNVALRWDAASGAKGYMVQRTSRMHGNIIQTQSPITATSFTDISQHFDPRYVFTYQVSAVYPDGRYASSSASYFPAPTNVQIAWTAPATNYYGWNTTWNTVPEAISYSVKYRMALKSYTGATSLYSWGTATWTDADTTFVVAAPKTNHFVYGQQGSVQVKTVAVSALFANGGRSAAASP